MMQPRGDQGVKFQLFSQRHQGHRNLQCAGHLHQPDLFGGHAQCQQFILACLSQRVGDVCIESCLHNADREFLAIQAGVGWHRECLGLRSAWLLGEC
jgi:hypothetical protein